MQRWVRTVAATAAAMLALALAAGCTPTPEPTPTPTGFASDAEAFRAAEETYRAYVDALTQVDLRDPKTFEPLYALTTGDANRAARKSFTEMHANGWTVEGESVVALVEPLSDGEPYTDGVELAVCVDVSDVQVVDADGQSTTGERPKEQSLLVSFELAPESTSGWLISSFAGRQGEPSCAS